jgi:hypothetical protein
LENYHAVLERADYLAFARNSVLVSLGSTLLALALAIPAATGVSQVTFDSTTGTYTGEDTSSHDGVIATVTGTYTVASNCTVAAIALGENIALVGPPCYKEASFAPMFMRG